MRIACWITTDANVLSVYVVHVNEQCYVVRTLPVFYLYTMQVVHTECPKI